MSATSIENIVKYFVDTDLTGAEIQQQIGKLPILYSDLKNYTFNKLLSKPGDYQVLLLQTQAVNTGHYVAIWLSLDGNSIYYWDSYGLYPIDAYKQYTPFDEEVPNYLTAIIASDPKKRQVIYNTTDFQKWGQEGSKKQSSVCGRWACTRIKLRMLDNDEFYSMFVGNQSSFLSRPDYVICILTLLGLDNIREFFDKTKAPNLKMKRNISVSEKLSRRK